MNMVDFLFLSRRRRRYSVERLTQLHQDLLSFILVDTTTTTPVVKTPAENDKVNNSNSRHDGRRVQNDNSHHTRDENDGEDDISDDDEESNDIKQTISPNGNSHPPQQQQQEQERHYMEDQCPIRTKRGGLRRFSLSTRSISNNSNSEQRHQQQQQKSEHISSSTRRSSNSETTTSTTSRRRDLQTAAFLILAATRSAEKEAGKNGHGVSIVRDDASVAAYIQAQTMEQTVVEWIREMQTILLHSCLVSVNSNNSNSSNATQQRSSSNSKNKTLCNSELRSDEVFEYFCEQEILSLFVQMVQEKPGMDNLCIHGHNNSSSSGNNNTRFHGVVWSPQVKAQALQTVSRLLHAIRNTNDVSALYYMLSQNSVNQLLTCMLPLQQWTDPALELMLPPYVDLLKNLTLQLSASPGLFPFFIMVHNKESNNQDKNNSSKYPDKGTGDKKHQDKNENKEAPPNVSFPLFAATLETGTSTYATQCDSYIHAECLNLTVDLLQIPHPSLQEFVFHHARLEQGYLARYLCSWTCQRTERMVQLTNGPVVDAVRSQALSLQLMGLDDQMQVWNDVFGCCCGGVSSSTSMIRGGLHVRLCEYFLQYVARSLLRELVEATPDLNGLLSTTTTFSSRPFLCSVGVHDADSVPETEGRAQVSTVVLTRLFGGLAYPPLIRMLAVALLLPQSTSLWFQQPQESSQQNQHSTTDDVVHGEKDGTESSASIEAMTNPSQTAESASSTTDQKEPGNSSNIKDEYILTPALNALVQDTTNTSSSSTTIKDNLFRMELVKALRGDYGEWRTVSAAILLETILRSPLLDSVTLGKLQILSPGISNNSDSSSLSSSCPMTDLETAVATFLADREHTCKSVVSTTALECVSSLAMYMIYKSAILFSPRHNRCDQQQQQQPGKNGAGAVDSNLMWAALQDARSYFFRQTLASHQALGVSDIFVDLMEAAVQSRYKHVRQQQSMYAYLLSQHGCMIHGASSEVLIRKLRSVTFNDVEATRFYARMAVHFRAVCRVVERFYRQLDDSCSGTTMNQHVHQQHSTPPSRSVPKLDLLDEAGELAVIFGSLRAKPAVGSDVDLHGRMAFPFSTDDSLVKKSSSSRLVLVLDPTDMMIVKPLQQQRQQQQQPEQCGMTRQLEISATNERATVLCCIPLLNVIGAAVDGEWLHVAVRHANVGSLIKNGNMALLFDCAAGTSLIVRQYLDRCRQVLRRELSEKIKDLLSTTDSSSTSDGDDDDIKKEPNNEKDASKDPSLSPHASEPSNHESSEDAIPDSKTW